MTRYQGFPIENPVDRTHNWGELYSCTLGILPVALDFDAAHSSLPVWYIATPEGNKDGPLTLADVRARFQAGSLQPTHLAWKEGMPGWLPAGQVEGLLIAPASPTFDNAPRASSPATAPQSNPPPGPTFSPGSPPVEQLLARIATPAFFRILGRVCGGLAILFALASIALVFFGVYLFTQVLLLVLMWMVGEGVAAILDSLVVVRANAQISKEVNAS